jgi:hypothetical protein
VVVFDDYVAYGDVREAIHDLANRRLYHLWGSMFAQAIGGAQTEPPVAVRRALRLFGARLQSALSNRRHRPSQSR